MRGNPKSTISIGFSTINQPATGDPPFMETPIRSSVCFLTLPPHRGFALDLPIQEIRSLQFFSGMA